MDWRKYKRDKDADNEDLIKKARLGCKESEDALFKNNLPLIIKLARRWTNKTTLIDLDEFVSVGCLAGHKAYMNFDINKECKFTTLLGRVVSNEFFNLVRDISTKKLTLYDKTSLDSEDRDSEKTLHEMIGSNTHNDFDNSLNNIVVKETLDKFYHQASYREKYILDNVYFGSKNLSEIGKEWGLTRSMTSLIHRKCINKLREIAETTMLA